MKELFDIMKLYSYARVAIEELHVNIGGKLG